MAQLELPSVARQRTVATTIDVMGATVRGAAVVAERTSFIGMLYATCAFTGLFIVLCCAVYPVLVWGVAQAIFPIQANGSLVTRAGRLTSDTEESVGSVLLSQNFVAPGYFHPRPSAAGTGYDAANSGGTNLGPLSDKLLNGIHGSKNPDGTPNPAADFDGVKDLAAKYRVENGLPDNAVVPADAVTRSASGLDPHISLENAMSVYQLDRVTRKRTPPTGDPEQTRKAIADLLHRHAFTPLSGLVGEPLVNVLEVNVALDVQFPRIEVR